MIKRRSINSFRVMEKSRASKLMQMRVKNFDLSVLQHNKRAEWLRELRNNKPSVLQNDIEITTRMVKEQAKTIPNWQAPRPDGVQGFWIKKSISLH